MSSIEVLRTIEELRAFRKRSDLGVVGLVPTMGALHSGHISLVEKAARDCSTVIVSIYVNPAQFGVSEDLDTYPKTFSADLALLESFNAAPQTSSLPGRVKAIFAPTTAVMYPSGPPGQEPASPGSFVTITPLSSLLEGKTRPTFFRGVATVCMKLFSAVQPDNVYFGQKDVQQTVVIRKMVRDFLLPVNVVIGETVREQDGLALSSRNVFLGDRRRAVSVVLSKALKAAESVILSNPGPTPRDAVMAAAEKVINDTLLAQQNLPSSERVLYTLDYFSIADPSNMEELSQIDPATGAILSTAIFFPPVEDPQPGENVGSENGPLVRLIDNIIVPGRP